MEKLELFSNRGSYVCFYNKVPYNVRSFENIKKGTNIILNKHLIDCFSFEILDIAEINLINKDVTLEVKMLENHNVPNEIYIISEQDEKYDFSYRVHGFKNTLEEAKEELLKYKYGQISRALLGDNHTVIVYENKRKTEE